MISIKKNEIRKMLIFLDYKKYDHLFMRELTSNAGSFLSCNGEGDFFINIFLSRKLLCDPDDFIVNHAHAKLVLDVKRKLNYLQLKHNSMLIFNLLKKYYHLEFVKL